MVNPAVAAKTSPAINPDRTSSGKEHFEVFDGFRGSAAFLIVIFHPFNYSFGWNTALSLVRHAYLAVDFFFGLSDPGKNNAAAGDADVAQAMQLASGDDVEAASGAGEQFEDREV